MAAQALYLKYRPQTFEEVVDQEPITHTLLNALRQGRVRHAYLFTGPRGTGKTTTARLLAKAVNCQAAEEDRPCNVCAICVAISEGRLLDLIEIDAASNRGIDEIRDIREKVGFRPNEGRFKVYVLDEAHMLTEPAFNALLKTLEEPPPHVIFTLVTTDPHKIPATITSRCQRFDFKRLPLDAIVGRLAYIAEQEGVAVEPAALELIARQGTGAMRDAISLLDQLTSYGDEITLEQVQMVLGSVSSEEAGRLVALLIDGDVSGGLALINRVVGDGADPRQFAREVVEYLRGLLLIREGAGTRLLNATAEQAAGMEMQADRAPLALLLRAIRQFNEAATDLRRGLQTIPQLPLEMALLESVFSPETVQVQATVAPAVPRQASPKAAAPMTVPPKPDLTEPKPASTESKPSAAEPQPEPGRVAQARQVAETPAPYPDTRPLADPEPQVEAPDTRSVPEETGTRAPDDVGAGVPGGAVSDALTLARVVDLWPQVVQAVRQRNRTTQAALNSGCLPVQVDGNRVVVTFPYPWLKDKLGDPQRMAEIEEALGEVLGVDCHLKLVPASEYGPGPQKSAQPQAASEPQATPAAGDEVPAEISRWAQEHGAQAKVVD